MLQKITELEPHYMAVKTDDGGKVIFYRVSPCQMEIYSDCNKKPNIKLNKTRFTFEEFKRVLLEYLNLAFPDAKKVWFDLNTFNVVFWFEDKSSMSIRYTKNRLDVEEVNVSLTLKNNVTLNMTFTPEYIAREKTQYLASYYFDRIRRHKFRFLRDVRKLHDYMCSKISDLIPQ